MPSTTFELKNKIFRAGAGAGKTTQLVNEVIEGARHFKKYNGRFPRMVVTTFTRKATQELRERLTLRAQELDDPQLMEFIISRNSLFISTIHGILSLFLTQYGVALGIDPEFRIIDEAENRKLAKARLRTLLLSRDDRPEILDTFDFNALTDLALKYNELRLTHSEMPVFGKAAAFELMNETILEWYQEARHLARRIESETSDKKWLELVELLRSTSDVLRGADWSDARQRILWMWEGFRKPAQKKDAPAISADLDAAVSLFSKKMKDLNDERYVPEIWERIEVQTRVFLDLADEFVITFNAEKMKNGCLSMADLELITYSQILKQPDTARRFSREWDYWFIDEFQDTSPLQVKILQSLIGERPHFVVGDPQQSIYFFRGARSEIFSQKEVEFDTLNAEHGFLKRNYRSLPELLFFLNDLFADFGSQFQAMEPRASELSQPLPVVARFIRAPESAGEIQGLCAHVLKLFENGARPEDICILARTHGNLKDIARALEALDIAVHIHASGGFYDRREIQDALNLLRFLSNPEDNLNLIALLRSPWFLMPDTQIAEVTSERGTSRPLWPEFVKRFGHRGGENTSMIDHLLRLLDDTRELGVSHVFRQALVDYGFFDFCHYHDVTGQREANLWKLVLKLAKDECDPGFSFIKFVNKNEVDLRDQSTNQDGNAIAALEPNRVNLMTIHASKGLQFKHVCVPFLNKRPQLAKSEKFTFDERTGTWSLAIPKEDGSGWIQSLLSEKVVADTRTAESQEAERLLYVALTRAQVSVMVTQSGEPERGSWGSNLRWDFTPGVHASSRYQWEVDVGPWNPKPRSAAESVALQPRPKFSDGKSADGIESVHSVAGRSLQSKTQTISVTDLIQEAQQVPPLRPEQLRAQSVKTLRGTQVHKLLEAYARNRNVDIESLAQLWFPTEADAVMEAIAFVETARNFPFYKILETGHPEWGFQFRHDGQLIQGQVDLWGIADGFAWIVDYKTGRPDFKEKAFEQMQIYARALRAFGVREPIQCVAVYPMHRFIEVRTATVN